MELIVETDPHEIDADVRRDMGGNNKAGKEARFAAVFRDPIELQMKVLRPYRPIRQEGPLDTTPCRPTIWIYVNAGWCW